MRVRLAQRRAVQCIVSDMIRKGYNSIYISHMNPRCLFPRLLPGLSHAWTLIQGFGSLARFTTQIDPHRSKLHTTGTTINVTCHVFVHHIYSSKVKLTYQINFIVGRFAAPLTYPGIVDLYDTNIGTSLACLKISLVLTVFESPIFMLG